MTASELKELIDEYADAVDLSSERGVAIRARIDTEIDRLHAVIEQEKPRPHFGQDYGN